MPRKKDEIKKKAGVLFGEEATLVFAGLLLSYFAPSHGVPIAIVGFCMGFLIFWRNYRKLSTRVVVLTVAVCGIALVAFYTCLSPRFASQGQTGDIESLFQKYLPLDERQALSQRLLARYPRGYAVFGVVDGKPSRTIEGLAFEKVFTVAWTGSEIAKLEPNYIDFYPPQIRYNPAGNAVLGVFNFRIERKVGFTFPYPYLPEEAKAFIEVLDDKGSFAALVLGFRE